MLLDASQGGQKVLKVEVIPTVLRISQTAIKTTSICQHWWRIEDNEDINGRRESVNLNDADVGFSSVVFLSKRPVGSKPPSSTSQRGILKKGESGHSAKDKEIPLGAKSSENPWESMRKHYLYQSIDLIQTQLKLFRPRNT